MQIQRVNSTPAPKTAAKPAGEEKRALSQDLVDLSERVTDKLRPYVMEDLAPGDKMIFQLLDGRKVVFENPHGDPQAKGWFTNVKEFITAGAQEVGVAINAGPNLALAGATELVTPVVLQGLPEDITTQVNGWAQPAVRGVSIAISLKRFLDRWNGNQTKIAAGKELTTWDKVGVVADGLHVLTSSAGLIGAVGGALFPSMQGAASIAKGVALAADVGSFAVNGLEYINRRAEINIMPVPEPPPEPGPPTPVA